MSDRNTVTDALTPADGAPREALLAAFDALLEPTRFQDYGPNGLQVEGKPRIRRLVSGVTASLALIEAAVEAGADAIVVHHGLFWRGQRGTVTGWMKARLQRLLVHDINLYAYHLPLDAHAELGNNAQLGRRLGFVPDEGGSALASSSSGFWVRGRARTPRRWPTTCSGCWGAPWSACRVMGGRSGVWPGAAVGRRAISRLPSPRVPTPF
jgi:hypothetical protein